MNFNLMQYRTGTQASNTPTGNGGLDPYNGGIDPTTNSGGAINGYYLGAREYVPTDITLRALVDKALTFDGRGFLNIDPINMGVLGYIAPVKDIRSAYVDDIFSNVMNRNSDASNLVLKNIPGLLDNMHNPNIYTAIGMYYSTMSGNCRKLPSGLKQLYSLNELMASYDLAYLESVSVSTNIQDFKSKKIFERVYSMLNNLTGEQQDSAKLKGSGYNDNNIYNVLTQNSVIPSACAIMARRAGDKSETFSKSLNDYLLLLKDNITKDSPLGNTNLPTFSMCTPQMMAVMKKVADGQQLSPVDISFAKSMTDAAEGYFKMQTDLIQVLNLAIMQNKIISNTGKCISTHVTKFKSAIETFARCKNVKEYMSAEKKLRELYNPETGSFSLFSIADLEAINTLQENAGRFLGAPQVRAQAGGLDSDIGVNKNEIEDNFRGYVSNVLPNVLKSYITDNFMNDNKDEILELYSSIGLGRNTQISMSSSNLLKATLGLAVMYKVIVPDNRTLFNLIMSVAFTAEGLAKYIHNQSGINYLAVVDAIGDAKSISANSHPYIKSDTGDFTRKNLVLQGQSLDSLTIWTTAFCDTMSKMGISYGVNPNNAEQLRSMFPGSFSNGGWFYKKDETDTIGALAFAVRMIVNNGNLFNITACRGAIPSEWYDGGSQTYAQIPQANAIFDALAKRKFSSYSELLNELQVKNPGGSNILSAKSSSEYRLQPVNILEYITNKLSVKGNGNNAQTHDMVASLELSATTLADAFNYEFA